MMQALFFYTGPDCYSDWHDFSNSKGKLPYARYPDKRGAGKQSEKYFP